MFSSIHELQSHLLVCSVTYMNYSVNKLHVLCICQIFILHLVVRSAMIGYSYIGQGGEKNSKVARLACLIPGETLPGHRRNF